MDIAKIVELIAGSASTPVAVLCALTNIIRRTQASLQIAAQLLAPTANSLNQQLDIALSVAVDVSSAVLLPAQNVIPIWFKSTFNQIHVKQVLAQKRHMKKLEVADVYHAELDAYYALLAPVRSAILITCTLILRLMLVCLESVQMGNMRNLSHITVNLAGVTVKFALMLILAQPARLHFSKK
jgi:hypothetical protein